jgi:hypothetical protein
LPDHKAAGIRNNDEVHVSGLRGLRATWMATCKGSGQQQRIMGFDGSISAGDPGHDHAGKLSALLTAEQGSLLAQARWEIDLLTKAFGPALMQMAPHEKEQDLQT